MSPETRHDLHKFLGTTIGRFGDILPSLIYYIYFFVTKVLLTTPTTPKDRMKKIVEVSEGFVYLVSLHLFKLCHMKFLSRFL